MKTTLALSITLILVTGLISSAQIGVNTNAPTANLDINGTLRVRSLEKTSNGFQASGTVLYIMGVDELGNVIPIEIGENIILKNNKLVVQLPEVDTSIGGLPNARELSDNYVNPTDPLINDLDLGIVILPGDPLGKRPVTRLSNGSVEEKVKITGFKSAPDGTMVYLYPTSGDVQLLGNSDNSQPENRILINSDSNNNDLKVKKNQMVLIMYDGLLKRWVVVSK